MWTLRYVCLTRRDDVFCVCSFVLLLLVLLAAPLLPVYPVSLISWKYVLW